MDPGWRFALGNACDPKKDFGNATGFFSSYAKAGYGDGPAARDFDDRGWRIVDLPHDWAAELPFDSTASSSHGYKPLGKASPGTSIGWYRRPFFIPASDLGRRISIAFDGVFRDCRVWVNGFLLGQEQSGYQGFQYDITDYLQYGGQNVVAVRVDATMEEGWFYEGAGIYRHVWLVKTAPLHVAADGTFVSSDVRGNSADVTARITVANDSKADASFSIDETIIDEGWKTVAQGEISQLVLRSGESNEYSSVMQVSPPRLWSPDSPYLYKLITTIRSGEKLVDRYETTFGIRTVRFDPQQGFFLNGIHLLLRGTNNHQDHAGVGTALPDALQEFRIRKLKEMGANAYRCSHNPPTPELLDACDRLGMLVIDENRLLGTSPEYLGLLKRLILRDRNHPSIIIWSLGNEEWALEGNATGARVYSTVQALAQRLDPTRRDTYANSGWGAGISTVADVMGFNYIFNGDIDRQHKDFPDQPSIGTEETTSRGTRGVYEDDPAHGHRAATDRKASGASIETGFKFYAERPFLSGIFFWTGFDYRGEPHPYGWPQVASRCGILDLCGFPKDMMYYLQSWWKPDPVLHLFPHWNWPGKEGQSRDVWAYSNCDSVELYLNGGSLGRKPVPKYSHVSWSVAYEPGTLLARGFTGGREIRDSVVTTGEPSALQLDPDRRSIRADGDDISVVTVRVNDAKGRCVPTADNDITFSLEGPGRIIGVGNGDPSSHEADRSVEDIRLVAIEHLKLHEVKGGAPVAELGASYDDSAWPAAFTGGDGNPGGRDSSEQIVLRGEFQLPAYSDSTEITLLAKSLGEVQSVYVNGELIAPNVRRGDPDQRYLLSHQLLHPGKNSYALLAHPLIKRNRWEILNTDPGLVQLSTPAPGWKRKAFNGLAQVIIQSDRQPGLLTLTASGKGLTPVTVSIETQASALRPIAPLANTVIRRPPGFRIRRPDGR